MSTHNHLVEIDEETNELVIYRVDPQGGTTLFTKTLLPKGRGWEPDVVEFAKLLGENLLMDSPVARRILDL
ncbi:hypothetical protein [Dokdonella soli]|uniref:hypothetical protein n=1 Tax=Dokdonella soli TaxID=529810 RepID=UPI00361ABD4E